MNHEQPSIETPSVENRELTMKHDTFNELYDEIVPLVANEEYGAVQGAINKKLLSLAGALGGDQNEQLRKLKEDFVAGLPEEIQLLIDPESPEAKARAVRARAEQFARVEALFKDGPEKEA